MTDYQKLYTGIGRAAWGYFFIYFDINLNTVSILPSFIGYLLFLSAINHLCDEERELNLLRTLGIILTVWHIASWFASFGAIKLDGMLPAVDIIIGVVNIYFHFQLLTNLASIAAKYQPEGYELDAKLLRYRTMQTVMLTAVIILGYLAKWQTELVTVISVGMIIVYLIVTVLLMKALFDLRRCLRMDNDSDEEDSDTEEI
ncbi:MAG: hypothetical protein IJA67_00400 [Oscillospiraceae bacterium]|nr:hypothetical protein [Oscillospiraceae bacterium]